jgi:hypothetical protein
MSLSRNKAPVCACLHCLCLVWTTAAWPETQRDLGSHEHGASALNVVIDGNTVFVEFTSPWMNLVGFEHRPATQEQLNSMTAALKTLEMPSELLTFNDNALCMSVLAEVNSTVEPVISVPAHAVDEDHADTDDEAHEETHAGTPADKTSEVLDDEEHPDNSHDHETDHSEVMASYSFECAEPDQISEMNVSLFETWPGIVDIDVQMAGPGGQSRAALSHTGSIVNLESVR